MISMLQHITTSDIVQAYKDLSNASSQNNDSINQLFLKIEAADYFEKIQLLYFYCQLKLNKQEQLLNNSKICYNKLFREIKNEQELNDSVFISHYSEFTTLQITTSDSFSFNTLSDETIQKLFSNVEDRIQKVYIQNQDYDMLKIAIIVNAQSKQVYKTLQPNHDFFSQFADENEYYMIIQTDQEFESVGKMKLRYLCYNNTDEPHNITLRYPELLQSAHLFQSQIKNIRECVNLQNLSSDSNKYLADELIMLKRLKRLQSVSDEFQNPKQTIEHIAPQLEYLYVYFSPRSSSIDINFTYQKSRYLEIQFNPDDSQQHQVNIILNPDYDQQIYYLQVQNGALFTYNHNKQQINAQTVQNKLQIEHLKKLSQRNSTNNIYQVMQQVLMQNQINSKKDILLNQFVRQYFSVNEISKYTYLKNIEYVNYLSEQQVVEAYHLDNDDYIHTFTQKLVPYVACKNLKQLQAVINFSKVLDTLSFSINFNSSFRFEDITDNIWNQILDLAQDHLIQSSYILDKDKEINICIARGVKNNTIIKSNEDITQTVEKLINDDTYDIFLSTDINVSKLGNIRLRTLSCISRDQQITLKYPTELKSVSLNYVKILNIDECEHLATVSIQGNKDFSPIQELHSITRFSSEQNTYTNLTQFMDQLFENNRQLQYVSFVNIDNERTSYTLKSELPNLKVFYYDTYEPNNDNMPRFMTDKCKYEQLEYAYNYNVLLNQMIAVTDVSEKPLKMKYIL